MCVFEALDKSKFDVVMIGIDRNGRWVRPRLEWLLEHKDNPREMKLESLGSTLSFLPDQAQSPLVEAANRGESVGPLDVIFPILHGTNGEDGTVQGLLELAGVPYVGAGVLGSSVCMDKEMAKRVLRDAGLDVVPFQSVRRVDFEEEPKKILDSAAAQFGYPYFVKPANAGSSVGVHKVKSAPQARALFEDAFQYDTKVIVEKAVDARELEVSVLGNHRPEASIVGEIVPRHEFYTYEAKYLDPDGADLKIPAEDLSHEMQKQIREMAVKAFRVLECWGFARVDMFLDRRTGELFVNELNTIPGFTPISMYPKLWGATGIPYAQLLERLIELAIERGDERRKLKLSFEAPKK